ncbi:putative primosomal protein N' [Kocuria dechangensis]|uniref:Probable replication restart protein PriA n=1 Tax=Kocuria dechangensis TaxID=1176249 RepID=A0A917GWL9_9MICC|nr:primosomal protein N' [Kocuria dechangensis]GGG59219.1 putative primosomal protein N' [Kocuria dechangensis]
MDPEEPPAAAEAPRQLSLLSGFPPRPPRPDAKGVGAALPAEHDPVARVLLDTHVPHLDRPFDYAVPAELAATAVPGVRVKVGFGGQVLTGFVLERAADSEVMTRLQPLRRVLSPLPVLAPEIARLAEDVAARSAGTVADVVRVAVPPRVARVEKEVEREVEQRLAEGPDRSTGLSPQAPGPSHDAAWADYAGGPAVLAELGAGGAPRAVVEVLPSHPAHDWTDVLAAAVGAAWRAGRGAVAVVPDQKALARLERAVAAEIGAEHLVRLHAEDGPTPRYRAFLAAATGQVRVVLGTRSAAYAPVDDLGLVCCWDDGDENLVEQRAPYQHARDVLLLRAERTGCAALFAGHAVSPEALRLVVSGWARRVAPPRNVLRTHMPRIVSTADSYHAARDPLASRARLPETAFRAAREALARGPVLVQVARAGYAPHLACERCREPARCAHCEGPLGVVSRRGVPRCGWCGRSAHGWACAACGSPRMRLVTVGALRTAEELGRAFPQVPVVASSGETVRATVPGTPALVVATPGAEPVAEGGYAAALLLDGNLMLMRPALRAAEQTLRRWFNAAALVRRARDGGVVVVTAEHESAVGALVRWDPAGHAERELAERQALGLPPAVRSAALTGPAAAVAAFLAALELPPGVRVIGPTPLEDHEPGPAGEPAPHRVLLFFGYGTAAEVTRRLRAARAEASALRKHAPVHVRCDVTDLL